MSTDRIEKRIVLGAPRARVWRALADVREFQAWFGLSLDGVLEPGAVLRGRVTSPPGYEHLKVELRVERVDPETLLSYRWHPYPVDPAADYSAEPMTLVELRLAEVPGGTELTVVESGFDRLPAARRGEAFRANEGGWAMQLENVRRHVAG